MASPQPGAPGRRNSGLVVVIALGVIFFVLLALLLLHVGKRKSEPSAMETETLTVMPVRLRIRTEPNAKAPVVTTATSGEKLILLEDRSAWVRVQDPDGLSGWAERNFLERTAEHERRLARYAAIRKLPALHGTVADRTALYAGPGIFYPLVGELPSKSEVQVYTRDHDFYAIENMGQVAYADIDSIDVTAAGAPQLDVGTTAPTTTAVATDTTATGTLPPATASTETVEPPVPTDESPAPEPVPATSDGGGVYAAVPPGGTQPEEVDRVVPRYPTAARLSGVAGAVVIRGIVRRDGSIDNVEIIKDLPQGLGESARQAVEHWRFRPATYRGEPIDVYYTVTVNFRLR
jgi:TonB family protein